MEVTTTLLVSLTTIPLNHWCTHQIMYKNHQSSIVKHQGLQTFLQPLVPPREAQLYQRGG